jgi:hypothetical protein
MAATACARSAPAARCVQRAARLQHSSFLPGMQCCLAAPAAAAAAPAGQQRGVLKVLAFRWDPRDPKASEKIQDWRVQQMVQLAHDYLIEYLTNKRAELAEQLFDEGVVHKDVVWDASHPTVGVEGMRHYLQDLSTAFPDFWVEIDQYATVDTNSIMVTYRGSATNLGEYHHHKATGHASNFEGANCFRFNHDRSRITHIDVYRSAFAEDLDEVGEKRQAQEGGFRELRLKRLVI